MGQYQHDVDQNKLKEALNYTVESCVNMVGVNVNTASRELLSHVSGIGPHSLPILWLIELKTVTSAAAGAAKRSAHG